MRLNLDTVGVKMALDVSNVRRVYVQVESIGADASTAVLEVKRAFSDTSPSASFHVVKEVPLDGSSVLEVDVTDTAWVQFVCTTAESGVAVNIGTMTTGSVVGQTFSETITVDALGVRQVFDAQRWFKSFVMAEPHNANTAAVEIKHAIDPSFKAVGFNPARTLTIDSDTITDISADSSAYFMAICNTAQAGQTITLWWYMRGEVMSELTGTEANPLFVDFPDQNHDAFGRLRFSDPETIFDSKQIFDNQPLLWDESLESGTGITSAHSVNRASTKMTSTLNTAGTFTRQTYQCFNYQPGKSQLVIMTGILGETGGGTGVVRRAGQFDDDNGVFFEDDEGVFKVVCRSSVSGSPVDTKVAQSDFNLDKLDGTGPSGHTIDPSKAQILFMDYEWLGVGRVRFGFGFEGKTVYCHEFRNSNAVSSVYMSTPNNPLRYQMITQSTSAASTLEAICATVISEGGSNARGVNRSASNDGTHVDANTQNTVYAILGVRLKSSYIGATIDMISTNIAEHAGNNNYEWFMVHNPTVTGTFTYADETNSAIQVARGAGAGATVTGGTRVGGGHGSSSQKGGSDSSDIEDALGLGAAIDGTRDEVVLCVRPIGGSTNLDIEGTINWRERQ